MCGMTRGPKSRSKREAFADAARRLKNAGGIVA